MVENQGISAFSSEMETGARKENALKQ